ncbi:unnamed protein product [Somion occarium]|uniref:Uncharacterized protein n=1 Tax=Somion occarium TaxID=3059160 RepID=A0ABP1E1I9_9APHY
MSSISSNDSYDHNDLSNALLSSTAYHLVYTIPLIVLSTLLAFAGSFLTLDRTRALPRTPKALDPRSLARRLHSWFVLEGGVGGILLGYAFGVHLATFLSMMIPNISNAAPLHPAAFLAVWLCSCLFTAVSCGRWKYVARTAAGLTGYSTLALSVSVIVHPSLVTRIVITAVFTILGTVACLLPFPAFSHVPVRLAASATGAFGIILSLALLTHLPAWTDVWERYWVRDDIEWGNVKEKGLSAAYCFIFVIGVACDWALHRYYGEDPDDKWNHYLADYTLNLPNDHHRAGDFRLTPSWWEQIKIFFSGEERKIQSQLQKPVTILKQEPWSGLMPGVSYQYAAVGDNVRKDGFIDSGSDNGSSHGKASKLSAWDDFWRDVKFQAAY